MPLDTGGIQNGDAAKTGGDSLAALRPVRVVLAQDGHVGHALRQARQGLGLVEDDIAQATRVRAPYIAAIEDFDFDALPARPFVVGYVRAYAKALGVDSETVVARFHAEAPKVDGKLRPPGGVRHDAFGAVRVLLFIGAALAAAVAAWTFWRHMDHGVIRTVVAVAPSRPRVGLAPGPAMIGAPLPTPPEATTPPVYITPGLAPPEVKLDGHDATPAEVAARAPGVGAPFAAAGTVYGAPAPGGGVILQARKATTLVIRGGGGVVYFARVLAPGEAWRAPATAGLTVDVGAPGAVEVFIGGISKGAMSQPRTPLSQIGQP
jgi:cytoskeleton protein RodZ